MVLDYARDDYLNDAIASRALIRADASRPGDWDDSWYLHNFSPSLTGLNVSTETAMQLSGWYRGVRLLASTFGSLPLKIFKTNADGSTEEATDHPLYELLHSAPNGWQTAMEFWETMEGHRVNYGNAYAQIVPGPSGPIDQLLPILPSCVTIDRISNGRLRYKIAQRTGAPLELSQDEIVHIRGFSIDGIRGVDPIWYQRETIGVALAQQLFAARFFMNDATPGGVFTHPKTLSAKALEHLNKQIRQKLGGVMNSSSPLVAEEGMTYTPMGINNRDAQFIESQRYSLGNIARALDVPLHMISEMERSTFSNIEQQSLEWVRDTIRPNCERYEAVIQRDLIDPLEDVTGPGYYAEFNLDALLRADFKTRQEGLAIQHQNGALTDNQWRALENRNPREDGRGDDYYHAANIISDKNAELAATTAAKAASQGPSSSARPAQPPPSDNSANLVTVRMDRELAVLLNGKIHWEEAA